MKLSRLKYKEKKSEKKYRTGYPRAGGQYQLVYPLVIGTPGEERKNKAEENP